MALQEHGKVTSRTIVSDLFFSECPRWHDGALWFSDMHGNAVYRSDLDGNATTVVEVPHDRPSGLGFLPDGRLLVVMMEAQKVLHLEPSGELVEHADLSPLARGTTNDMIVRADGTAYVGDMGMRLFRDDPGERLSGQTLRITPDGEVSCAADDLSAPNGHILTDDERTLIVAESSAGRISAFDVQNDGTLTDRRTFAQLEAVEGQPLAPPDGICLDAEGAVWAAEILGRRVLRVRDGGEIADTIPVDGIPTACVLAGDDRRTLVICVVDTLDHHVVQRERTSRIDVVAAEVPGAGRP